MGSFWGSFQSPVAPIHAAAASREVSSLDRTKNVPKESPRFDEVSTMATPREAIGGEFRTPGDK